MSTKLIEFVLVSLLVFASHTKGSAVPELSPGPIVYTRGQLIALCNTLVIPGNRLRRKPQIRHLHAHLLISGDLNHASLSSLLPTFTHVICNTRDNNILD